MNNTYIVIWLHEYDTDCDEENWEVFDNLQEALEFAKSVKACYGCSKTQLFSATEIPLN